MRGLGSQRRRGHDALEVLDAHDGLHRLRGRVADRVALLGRRERPGTLARVPEGLAVVSGCDKGGRGARRRQPAAPRATHSKRGGRTVLPDLGLVEPIEGLDDRLAVLGLVDELGLDEGLDDEGDVLRRRRESASAGVAHRAQKQTLLTQHWLPLRFEKESRRQSNEP